jgi:hypothetical protein
MYVQYNIWLSCIGGIPFAFLTHNFFFVEGAGTFEFESLGVITNYKFCKYL